MANPIAEALLAGQRIKSGQQAIQLNEQNIQQQQQIQGVQQSVQTMLSLRNMITAGATDQDLQNAIGQAIQSGQGGPVEDLIDAGNILKTQGRGAFVADLDDGMDRAQTFQDSGLINVPGLVSPRIRGRQAGVRVAGPGPENLNSFLPLVAHVRLAANRRIRGMDCE